MQKWIAWVDKLKKDDRYVSGEPLLPQGKIVKGTKKVITDVPLRKAKNWFQGSL